MSAPVGHEPRGFAVVSRVINNWFACLDQAACERVVLAWHLRGAAYVPAPGEEETMARLAAAGRVERTEGGYRPRKDSHV